MIPIQTAETQNMMGLGKSNIFTKPGGGLPDMEWGIRMQRQQEMDRLINMPDAEFAKWMSQNQSNRPGGWAETVYKARMNKKKQQSQPSSDTSMFPPSWLYAAHDRTIEMVRNFSDVSSVR